jgi:two-component system NtrC family sensor kinase
MASRTFHADRGGRNDYPLHRQVWIKAVLVLLTVSLCPLVVIGGGVVSYTFNILESRISDGLRQQVREHQQAIDRFLETRERGLKTIVALHCLADLTEPGRLDAVYDTLAQQMPGFTDLGVIDMEGNHRAYTGPHALASQNYSGEAWFLALTEGSRDSYISDIYPGFRQSPHFIIAVRQGHGDDAFILRATVDSGRFDALVAGGLDDVSIDAFIVNRDGAFQTRPRQSGELSEPSGIHPDPEIKGVQLLSNGDELLVMLWQEKVPWLNVVRVNKRLLHAGLHRSRFAVFMTFLLGGALIVAAVLLATGSLVRLLEAKGRRLRILDRQLRRTSYLAASMELSVGFIKEIKDVFLNIGISARWLADHGPKADASERKASLSQISGEASRGGRLLDKFSLYMQDEEPVITEVDVNGLLDDLLSFLHRELEHRGIHVARNYQASLPPLRSDRGKLRQVFQNLLLNAVSVLETGGEIRLTTCTGSGGITVVIRDNGPGIPRDDLARIFEPLYTTKPRGSGLGLPICSTILNQLGGSISVDSSPGGGAAFTVTLPGRILSAC